MYELMELLQLHSERQKKVVLFESGGNRKFVPVLPHVEQELVPQDVQAKLTELVKKLSDVLPALSQSDTKKFDLSQAFKGVEGKNIPIDSENIEKIAAKILEFTETLADSSKKLAATVSQTEQSVKLGAIPGIEGDEPLKLAAEAKSVNTDEPEAVKAQPAATVVSAGRSDGGQQQEASEQDDNKQSLTQTAAPADSIKTAAAPAQTLHPVQPRPELPAMPAPVVRMNNLTEELGEVFKNSLRMSTSGESTQIKVNITPDHLGHLDIRLTETNGRIAAQIFTSSMAAKDAMDLHLSQLRSMLVQQGLTIEKLEVVQHNSQQSLGQQNAQSEQRFTQQQRQNSAGRETNGYQQLEEKSAVDRSHYDTGMMKVDYTV